MGTVIMFALAFILAVINRGTAQSRVYNQSRWLLIAASILFGIHNVIQFIGHFRESSPTLAWFVNIFFFTPVIMLYSLGEINLLRSGRDMRRLYIANGALVAVSYILFAVGYATDTLINDDAPWKTTTFAAAFILFVMICRFVWIQHKEMQYITHCLVDNELDERYQALKYTVSSLKLLLVILFVSPWCGMSSSLNLHSAFGFIMFFLVLWYLISFFLYGANMREVIEMDDEIKVAKMNTHEPSDITIPDNVDAIIEQWVQERHFTDPNMSIGQALKQMNIPAAVLNYYLVNRLHITTFRKWIPYLRIEETKRLLLQHPDYKLDAIAPMVGMSNGSALSRSFKAQLGVTPTQWLEQQKS